ANINLPPTQRRGAELEGSWRATPALEWRGSLALLEAKFRATGREVPLVPDAIATAGMSWSFAARSRLNLNARYVGKQRYDNDQDNLFARRMPAYGLLDAKLEHRVGRVDLAFEVRNLFGRLRARRYDLLIHLSEQPRGAWLARTLGARYAVAPAMPGRGRFWAKSFTHLYPVVGGGRRHQVELNLDALRRIGIQPSLAERKVVFVPGKQAEAKASRLAPEGFIHMHPASRWTFKCWPAEKNAELIDRFASEGHQVVLTSAGDPAELDMVQKIVALSKARTISLAGTLSIKELGALTARARLFVGVDS